MAQSQLLAIPSKEPLPHNLRLPSTHPSVLKTLSKLSRSSLIQLAAEWCAPKNVSACGPYINNDYEPDDSDVLWSAQNTVEEVADYYHNEATRKKFKRELIDHMLEGDWRHGISLQQIAMAECQILADHPDSTTWTAFQIYRYRDGEHQRSETGEDFCIPRTHAPSLVLSLHQEIASLTKAHYYVTRHVALPVTLIRIALFDTPYSDSDTSLRADLITSSKSLFVAFPDGAPFCYVSLPSAQATKTMETDRSLLSYVIKAIPKAISRPSERYDMKPTRMTAKSLDTLLAMRGATRESGVSGGWSSYALDDSHPRALDFTTEQLATKNDDDDDDAEEGVRKALKRAFDHSDPTGHMSLQKQKRLKDLAAGRFGNVGTPADKKVLGRFDVKVEDAVKGNPGWQPSVHFSFQGTHVFSGLRKLTELGVLDASRMPAWITGEAASNVGSVKEGRMARWDADIDD